MPMSLATGTPLSHGSAATQTTGVSSDLGRSVRELVAFGPESITHQIFLRRDTERAGTAPGPGPTRIRVLNEGSPPPLHIGCSLDLKCRDQPYTLFRALAGQAPPRR